MAEQQNRRPETRIVTEGVTASEVELYIGDIDFPCDKDDLIEHANDNSAPDRVLEVLERFPEKQYASTVDIVHGFSFANQRLER